MFKNYLKLAWRNLFRHKSFSVINLLGLTSGITCTIFIFLWVQDELTFDKSHKNYDGIYQVLANRDFKNQVFTDPNMVFPLGFALNEGLPQIKASVVTTHSEPHILDYKETRVKKNGYSVSEKFFKLFSWKFTQGNPATALADPSSLVITQSTAKAFFGNDDPLNKTIRIDHQTALKVTGVVQDPPGNSTLQFDFIRPFNLSDPNLRNQMGQWRNSSWNVYVLMNPDANIAQLDKDIDGLMKKHDPEEQFSTYFSFPMNRWRLYSEFREGKNVGGMIQYVRLFTIIAVIILLIACVNFMNLSTARSEKRAREVGIRKTLGSDRKRLIFQFFMESTLLTLTAFVFSLLIVFVMMPAFNLLVGKQLSFDLSQPAFWKWAALIVLITGLVAGSYPALYLSSFNPLKVLSGTFLSGRRAILPRRILVVGQFIISILLISATVIVYQQMNYIRNRDMGYNPNNLIMIPSTQNTDQKFSAFKQELFQTGIVTAVTRTSSPMTQIWWKFPCPDYAGKPADATAIFSGLAADADFT
ncbi:MAG TPA: ABC transporter permease, partial [Flavitalea sp.]|nr:ABC transporter permease [Flavitalea sp.]